ncbi:hypothetical protein [Streptomyces sp. SPB78]|nr:hypothetical protein [Streptomyces sp. SPB78]
MPRAARTACLAGRASTGFDGIAPQAALSQTARTTRTEWLRRLLGE